MSDRFDYEGVDSRAAYSLMRDLEAVITDKAFTTQKFSVGNNIYSVEKADNFEYIDPVDGSVSRKQVSPTLRENMRDAVKTVMLWNIVHFKITVFCFHIF